MDTIKFVSSKEAREILGVSATTLRNYANKGIIDHIKTGAGGDRKYNVKKYLEDNGLIEKKVMHKVCYCRVSTHGQKDNLDNQINYMTNKYPGFELVTDIGSGINFKRKGIQKIIEYAINGELETLVVSYKDRLCRIGFDMIEFILLKYSNTKIIIENDSDKSPDEEMAADLLEVITVFSAKIHGSRSYKDTK